MDTKRKIRTEDFFSANPVFSLDEATEALDTHSGRAGTIERLKYYLKTGRLKLVTREVYAVASAGGGGDFQPDPFLVAIAVRNDAIFSYHSALELLGVGHSVWNRCVIHCGHRRSPLVLKHGSIDFLQDQDSFVKSESRYLGTQKVERRGRLLTVTGPERTIVDGFRRPVLCGGVEELIQSASGFAVLDLDMLKKVLLCYNIARLWAATGWFLEQFQKRFHVPETVLQEMEKYCPSSTLYIERGLRGGVLYPRWNLILPESIIRRSDSDEP